MVSKTESVLGYFVFDLLGSLPHFPVWWYGRGFLNLVHWVGRTLRFRIRAYGFRIWLANFFVPMYGQYDWSGRLVSLIMRFFVLLGRTIALIVEAMLHLVLMVLWLCAPLFVFLSLAITIRLSFSDVWYQTFGSSL